MHVRDIKPAEGLAQMHMASPLMADSTAPLAARLLIHADGNSDSNSAASGHDFKSLLQRLRALYPAGPQHHERLPLRLQIIDLQGHEVLALDDAGPLVDVVLPAGTYHVAAQLDHVRRGYTMTLKHGASFDLYLRLAPGRQ